MRLKVFNFLCLSLLLFVTSAYSMDGRVETRLEPHPNSPAVNHHPMNENMGDFTSLMNGGSTEKLRQANEARSKEIEKSMARVVELEAQLAQKKSEALSRTACPSVSFPSVDDLIQKVSIQNGGVIPFAEIPDPPEASLPYQFVSQGEFREEILRQYKDLFKIEVKGIKRQTAKELGLLSTQSADQAYSVGEFEDASFFKELGKTFLDVAVGLDPVTGFGRSAFELFTGRNIVTGANLNSFERSFAFLGVATLGGANTAKTVTKIFHAFEGAGKLLKERAAFQAAVHEGQNLYEKVSRVLSGMTQNHKIIAVHAAEDVNKLFPHYRSPSPFQYGSHVIEFQTIRESKWVRVHSGTNEASPWIMRQSAIEGLSPQQIREKFAIPTLPTHVSDVHVPSKTMLLRGNIQNIEGGMDGAVQYFLKEVNPDWFKNMRPL